MVSRRKKAPPAETSGAQSWEETPKVGGSSPRATAITESLGDLAMIEAVRLTKRDLVHTRNAFHPLLPAMGAHAYASA